MCAMLGRARPDNQSEWDPGLSTEGEPPTTLQIVGSGVVDLAFLARRHGIEGARSEFEKLIEDIVGLKIPRCTLSVQTPATGESTPLLASWLRVDR